MKKETKRKIIARSIAFLLPSLSVGSLFRYVDYKSKLETVARVDSNVRNELYNEDLLDYDKYFEIYDHACDEDKFVTKEVISKINYLEFDLKIGADLSVIKDCPNLKTIKIWNSEMLTDEEINMINNSNAEEVILNFDLKNVGKKREERFDVSKITKKVKIVNQNCFHTDDVNILIFYNYLKNYSNDNLTSSDEVDYYQDLNNKLDKIMESINLDEDMTDKEKILLISNYICNHIEYDKVVYDATMDVKDNNETELKDGGRVEDYNYYSLSSLFDQESESKNGVCINYASLFDIMCYKANIKSRIVIGSDKDSGFGHAWNIVYLDDKKYYVDLTNFDSFRNEVYLCAYASDDIEDSDKQFYYDSLVKRMFKTIDDNYTNYELIENIDQLDKEPRRGKVNNYYNEEIEGKVVMNQDYDNIGLMVYALTSGSLGVLIEELYRKTKEKKKVKKLTSNN